jgi:hypothetical protein
MYTGPSERFADDVAALRRGEAVENMFQTSDLAWVETWQANGGCCKITIPNTAEQHEKLFPRDDETESIMCHTLRLAGGPDPYPLKWLVFSSLKWRLLQLI